MNRSDLGDLLEAHGIRPVHARGQNFLLDDGVIDKMLAAADVRAGDRIVEIGPGPGVLTEKLLAAGAEVVAVEIDAKLRELLRARFGDNENFTLVEGDALMFDNEELVARFMSEENRAQRTENGSLLSDSPFSVSPFSPYKLVANLPYAITSATLQKFLLEDPKPVSITLLLQREVVDRVLAKPRDMSSLAVMCQTYADAQKIVNVPAGSFFPPPKVDSAVIHMTLKTEEALTAFLGGLSPERYFSIVRTAFAGRRKQLKNTLHGLVSDESALNEAFLKAGIKPQARPEELTVQDWVKLGKSLTL